MTTGQEELLGELSRRYIWWKPAEQALKHPARIAAQVMNLGDYDDVQRLVTAFGDDFLRCVIQQAEIGQFDPRSWHYRHYRLGLAELGAVPALPVRKLG
jgi:hypothetical protein